jgi:hypothetical protein
MGSAMQSVRTLSRVILDAVERHDETLVCLHGGAIVLVPRTLDEALAWFEQIGETPT